MPRRAARDLTVGAVLALALLVLAVGIMAVGEGSQMFASRVHYRVIFPNTVGLRVGSPVSMAGVELGSVSDIRLPTEPEAPGIEVTLKIDHDYAPRIRENSQAALRYLQILSGEKLVEITPGDPSLPELPAGATIPPLEQTEFYEQGADIAANINDITGALKEILGPLERGEGLLGEMIHNPEFGMEGIESLRTVLDDLSVVTEQLRQGKGFMGRVLFDKEFAGTLDNLSKGVEDFALVMESIGKKEGAIGALLEEGGAGQQAIQEFRDAAGSLNRTALKLESTDNLVGRLLNDSEYSEQVAGDLQALLRNLREVSEKINTGQGTIGALVNSRVVYDSMEDIVAGVDDSKFARWMLRHYQKKGIKAQEKEEMKEQGKEGEP